MLPPCIGPATSAIHRASSILPFSESGLPLNHILGKWASLTDISRRAVDKVYGYVGETDDGESSRRAEEALTPAILRSQERIKILRWGR